MAEGTNRYTYVRNQPSLHRDPTGLLVELQCKRLDSAFGEWGGLHCGVRIRFNCLRDGFVQGAGRAEIQDTLIELDQIKLGDTVLGEGAQRVAALAAIFTGVPVAKPVINFYSWNGPMSGSAARSAVFAPFNREPLMTLPGRLPGEREHEILFRAQAAMLAPPTYNAFYGPNSNTLAKELLRGLFYLPAGPSGAYGWDAAWQAP
jgi:hypothetical protein